MGVYGCIFGCEGNKMLRTESMKITPELLSLISELDEFKGSWKALGTLAPERLNALRKIATIESIGSSTRIEGSKLSDKEVERLLSNLEIKSFGSRDEQEVAGYADIMETIFDSWQEIRITENFIRQLHRDLLVYSEKDEWHRGNYKTSSNRVAAFNEKGEEIGTIFETATPFETPQRMNELLNWYSETDRERKIHPLLVTSIFIVVFLEIHPFQDGNGRLSRILTTLLLMQQGYVYVPYSSLESIIEQSKKGYYLALRQTQQTIRTEAPDWNPWLLFFLKALQQQKRRLSQKIEKEKIILVSLPPLSITILDHAKQHGRVTMKDMTKITGANRNTLKDHFKRLVVANHLKKHGMGKGTWYSLS
jgi:Fic family protein